MHQSNPSINLGINDSLPGSHSSACLLYTHIINEQSHGRGGGIYSAESRNPTKHNLRYVLLYCRPQSNTVQQKDYKLTGNCSLEELHKSENIGQKSATPSPISVAVKKMMYSASCLMFYPHGSPMGQEAMNDSWTPTLVSWGIHGRPSGPAF